MLRIFRAIVFLLAVLFGVLIGTLGAPFIGAAWRSVFPERLTWTSKSAFAKCSAAIAHPADWPREPKAACAAMTMCKEEAELSQNELAALREQSKRLPGCPGF